MFVPREKRDEMRFADLTGADNIFFLFFFVDGSYPGWSREGMGGEGEVVSVRTGEDKREQEARGERSSPAQGREIRSGLRCMRKRNERAGGDLMAEGGKRGDRGMDRQEGLQEWQGEPEKRCEQE